MSPKRDEKRVMRRDRREPLPEVQAVEASGRKTVRTFDYKQAENLRRYLTENGSLMNRENTGLTSKQQRQLTRAVKRARHLALLPFVTTV